MIIDLTKGEVTLLLNSLESSFRLLSPSQQAKNILAVKQKIEDIQLVSKLKTNSCSKLDREQITDLLTGALEGGSNYWCLFGDLTKVHELTSNMAGQPLVDRIITCIYDHNLSIEIYDIENPDELLGDFDYQSIKRAEEAMMNNYISDFMDILKENDDANTADIWFQLVVMGEVIFS